jgi:hypothetical protein
VGHEKWPETLFVTINSHLDPDVVTTILVGKDLQGFSLKADPIIRQLVWVFRTGGRDL